MHRHVTTTCQGKEPVSAVSGPWAVWADALFASSLQRSDNPSTGQIRQAITAGVYAFGGPGCAERVAQEFSDHPETAVMRMRWARAAASELFGSAPGPPRNDPKYGLVSSLTDPGHGAWRDDDSAAHPYRQAEDPA